MKRVLFIAAIGALVLSSISAVFYPLANAQTAQKALVSGWFRDRQVKYYDFGTNTHLATNHVVSIQPIFVFIHGMNADGTPQMVEGQHNIVGVVPGDDGYSDLWQVTFVTVPQNYQPDSVRSAQDIRDAGYETTVTDMFVNCPIVPEGTTLEGGEELKQGWHNDEKVFYPDFGANPTNTQPIWVFIHGMNADGTPDLVQGQSNIIDTVPGDAGYSAFWQVNMVTVPAGYQPNSIKSAADVRSSGYPIAETQMVVNCPVTQVAGLTVAGMPSTGTGPNGSGGSSLPYILIGTLAALGALGASGAGFAFARRRA